MVDGTVEKKLDAGDRVLLHAYGAGPVQPPQRLHRRPLANRLVALRAATPLAPLAARVLAAQPLPAQLAAALPLVAERRLEVPDHNVVVEELLIPRAPLHLGAVERVPAPRNAHHPGSVVEQVHHHHLKREREKEHSAGELKRGRATREREQQRHLWSTLRCEAATKAT